MLDACITVAYYIVRMRVVASADTALGLRASMTACNR
jgi:hypothetical protein